MQQNNQVEPHLAVRGSAAPRLQIDFSEDGKTFVATFEDKSVFVWETEKGKQLHRLELDAPPKDFSLSSDGRWLAVSHEKSVDVWDLKTGKRSCRIPAGKSSLRTMCLGYKSGLLALGSPDEPFQIWNVEAGKEILRFDAPVSPAESLAFTRDDKQLAAGLKDKRIRLFDLETKQEVRKFEGQTGSVAHLLFHPEGKLLISASKREVAIWNALTGKLIRTQRLQNDVERMGLTADGQRVLIHPPYGQAFHFSIEKNGSLVNIPVTTMAYSYAGQFDYSKKTKRLVVTAGAGLRVLDQKTGREFPFILEKGASRVIWAADGRTLMAASSDLFGFDVEQQKEVYRIPQTRLNGPVTSMMRSPDGQTAATAIFGLGVSFWEPRTGRLLREVSLPATASISSMQFSSDGRLLFVLAYDTYYIIEVESGLVWLKKGIQHGPDNSFAQLGPHTLLSAESQGTARLWSWAPEGNDVAGRSPAELWESLGKADGPTVYQSMFALAEWKDKTVDFLAQRLPKAKTRSASPEKIASLIKDLEDSSPALERKASEELRKLDHLARPHLKAALKNEDLSPETRTRIQRLLSLQTSKTNSRLSTLRASSCWNGSQLPKPKNYCGTSRIPPIKQGSKPKPPRSRSRKWIQLSQR